MWLLWFIVWVECVLMWNIFWRTGAWSGCLWLMLLLLAGAGCVLELVWEWGEVVLGSKSSAAPGGGVNKPLRRFTVPRGGPY